MLWLQICAAHPDEAALRANITHVVSTHLHAESEVTITFTLESAFAHSCNQTSEARRLIGLRLFSSVEAVVMFDQIHMYRTARDALRDDVNPLGSDCNVLKAYFAKDVSDFNLNQCKQEQTGVLIKRLNVLADRNKCGDICKGSVAVAALLLICLVVVIVKYVYDKRKSKKPWLRRSLNTESLDTEVAEAKLILDLLNTSSSWPDSSSSQSANTEEEEANLLKLMTAQK